MKLIFLPASIGLANIESNIIDKVLAVAGGGDLAEVEGVDVNEVFGLKGEGFLKIGAISLFLIPEQKPFFHMFIEVDEFGVLSLPKHFLEVTKGQDVVCAVFAAKHIEYLVNERGSFEHELVVEYLDTLVPFSLARVTSSRSQKISYHSNYNYNFPSKKCYLDKLVNLSSSSIYLKLFIYLSLYL